jgi:deazaflavin-dependent oxidoreductase (nitroreductase family)
MWFRNKIANPFVRLLLRSPLHGMLSAALLLITYHGRKSGKEYTLPVQYVQDDHVIYIVSGEPEQKTWWRNLRGGTPVRLLLAGRTFTGKANILAVDAEAVQIARALGLYLQHFPAAAKMYTVRRQKDGSFNQEDLRRAVASNVIVRVELEQ